MSIQMSHRIFQPSRGRSITRSTVVLLAVAAMGYVAGALVHDKLPPPNDSVAFAQPVRAAGTNSYTASPAAASPATVPDASGLFRFDAARTDDPRECDLLNGILTACVFMD
jgi:hypothetical protein